LPPTTLPPTTLPAQSVWERVLADPALTQFADAVEQAGLIGLLDSQETVPDTDAQPEAEFLTVLAPTNEAIGAIANWDEIAADPAALERFVLSHLIGETLTAEAILALPELTTLGEDILTIDPEAQTVNGARFVTADETALNGLVHSVDSVLVVPTLTPPPTEPAPETPATEPPTAATPPAGTPAPTDTAAPVETTPPTAG